MGTESQPPFQIPAFYRPPDGGPLRWQDETSGVLIGAIRAYLEWRQHEMSEEQIAVVREWLRYYIMAPCWVDPDGDGKLEALRRRVVLLKSSAEIDAWMDECLEMGIDPI